MSNMLTVKQLERIKESINTQNMIMGTAMYRVVEDFIALRKVADKIVEVGVDNDLDAVRELHKLIELETTS